MVESKERVVGAHKGVNGSAQIVQGKSNAASLISGRVT